MTVGNRGILKYLREENRRSFYLPPKELVMKLLKCGGAEFQFEFQRRVGTLALVEAPLWKGG